jgi:hypothetical protein
VRPKKDKRRKNPRSKKRRGAKKPPVPRINPKIKNRIKTDPCANHKGKMNMAIASNLELKNALERAWLSAHAREATQDLIDGTILEEFYEDRYIAYVMKTGSNWEVLEGPAPRKKIIRLFYYQDALDMLAQSTDLASFGQALMTAITEKKLVFIPLRPPETLIEAGFGKFAERVGLPAKS